MSFSNNDFPNQRRLAVFGDTDFNSSAEQMAYLLGQEIINAGCTLLIGGEKGVGTAGAEEGAYQACLKNETKPEEAIFILIAKDQEPHCWYCDVDPLKAHDEWFCSKDQDETARKMFRIRHKYF